MTAEISVRSSSGGLGGSGGKGKEGEPGAAAGLSDKQISAKPFRNYFPLGCCLAGLVPWSGRLDREKSAGSGKRPLVENSASQLSSSTTDRPPSRPTNVVKCYLRIWSLV